MAEEQRGIASLYKSEDWLGVWVGFFVIAIVLAGVAIKTPKFKWVTDGEFASYIQRETPQVEKFGQQAKDKGEQEIQTAAAALVSAIGAGDRKGVGDAAKKFESAAKNSKDEGLKKKAAKLGKDMNGHSGNTLGKVFSAVNLQWSLIMGIAILVLGAIAMALLERNVTAFVIGFPVVYLLSWIGMLIPGNFTVGDFGIEYVLWCLVLGLFVSNVIGVPDWLRAAVQTEFFIKTGLVILGSGILFKEILEAGALGIIQAIFVVGVIWYLTYVIARKMQVDEEFSAILASAVSICGVSAAIATSGAIKGDPKKLSYTTSIVLLCALPMLVLQPMIAKWVGMPDAVAGAWLGGTLDTSPSVVAAGSIISEAAMKVGVIVKMSQNVLIGVAAFILAVVWTFKRAENIPGAGKPSAMEIWYRFPKFVLGFICASLFFSFVLAPESVNAAKGTLGSLRTLWFALAFVCIGLETRFVELLELGGGRPALAFLIGQILNIFWTLILAYLLFGGILFPPPKF